MMNNNRQPRYPTACCATATWGIWPGSAWCCRLAVSSLWLNGRICLSEVALALLILFPSIEPRLTSRRLARVIVRRRYQAFSPKSGNNTKSSCNRRVVYPMTAIVAQRDLFQLVFVFQGAVRADHSRVKISTCQETAKGVK